MKSFLIQKSRDYIRLITICLLIFTLSFSSYAQYKGAPVKKERLIKALRSKQLQSEDIVAVINSNGVDFRLTEDVRKMLVSAGARPEVIRAVNGNFRQSSAGGVLYAKKQPQKINPSTADYNELLEKAIFSYEDKRNPNDAARFLQAAIKIKPKDSKAYQMLGFVNLYGLSDLESTRKYMREAIAKGGSAVFRVYHDDTGNFKGRCTGSLYISPERIRFESDDNIHTFETTTVNVEKIETAFESSKEWKNYSVFKLLLKFGREKAKFKFSPISGKMEESNMAAMFINESQGKELKGIAALSF